MKNITHSRRTCIGRKESIMKDWSNYQQRNYNRTVHKLLTEFCTEHKINNAVDLGCGSGNESVYLLKNGIKVTCIDSKLNKSFILERLEADEVKLVSFIESSFEEVILPKTEMLMAFFSIPFCSPDKFNLLWDKIYECLEPNGYFVGQLFGDRDDWNNNKNINTFAVEEAKHYLERYNVIKFEEIEYTRKSDNKKWHYYDIIAKKK